LEGEGRIGAPNFVELWLMGEKSSDRLLKGKDFGFEKIWGKGFSVEKTVLAELQVYDILRQELKGAQRSGSRGKNRSSCPSTGGRKKDQRKNIKREKGRNLGGTGRVPTKQKRGRLFGHKKGEGASGSPSLDPVSIATR